MSTILEDEDFRASSQPSNLGTMGMVSGLMTEGAEFVLRLNEYQLFQENLERKLSEQDVTVEWMTGL